MDILALLSSDVYVLVILPILIFLSRIADVSIGTMRVILISKGMKLLAPVLGFFEIIIWLTAIQQIVGNLANIFCFFAYAFGFAAGTYVGMVLEERISIGKVLVRVITKKDATPLLNSFKEAKYTVTSMGAKGYDSEVNMIFTVIRRQNVPKVIEIIKKFNPQAFYSIEDVKYASEDGFSLPRKRRFPMSFGFNRKGK